MLTVSLASAFAPILLGVFWYWKTSPSKKSIPGPAPAWIVGNALQIPKKHPWLTFAYWAGQHGPVFQLKTFQQTLIVLNDIDSMVEILEKRSSISSDRPSSYMIGELIGRKLTVFNMSSQDPRHRIYRKMLHSSLNLRQVATYATLLQDQVAVFIGSLEHSPSQAVSHIRWLAGSIILKIAYGYTTKSEDDSFIEIVDTGLREIGGLPLGLLAIVDGFPFLRFLPEWTPFLSFKRLAKRVKVLSSRIQNVPFQWTKSTMDTPGAEDSFVSYHLKAIPETADRDTAEDIVKWCAAALYAGGADTTVSILTSFLYLMGQHPEIQRRAQEEIDSVVGNRSMPTVEDQVLLPYCRAVMKEVMRWGPVAPLGLRHKLIDDVVYKDMILPKGSTVIPNIWAVLHDPNVYPQPSKFDPDRHLGDCPSFDPLKVAWGFGRRVCPGNHLAEVSMLLTMSTILRCFDVLPGNDNKGENEVEWTGILLAHLTNVKCRFVRRHVSTEGEA